MLHTYERFHQEQECIQLPQFYIMNTIVSFIHSTSANSHKKSFSHLTIWTSSGYHFHSMGSGHKFKLVHILYKIWFLSTMTNHVTSIWGCYITQLGRQIPSVRENLSKKPQYITSKMIVI